MNSMSFSELGFGVRSDFAARIKSRLKLQTFGVHAGMLRAEDFFNAGHLNVAIMPNRKSAKSRPCRDH